MGAVQTCNKDKSPYPSELTISLSQGVQEGTRSDTWDGESGENKWIINQELSRKAGISVPGRSDPSASQGRVVLKEDLKEDKGGGFANFDGEIFPCMGASVEVLEGKWTKA